MNLGNYGAAGLIGRAKQYLKQQAELYGGQFYSDIPENSQATVTKDGALEAFHREIKNCAKCRLAKSRTNFVFGTGNPSANLMCIGEAPGFEEDREGEPFVGAAGQLLNKILAAIGFAREEVYIANIIKCRPPGNRDPEADEVETCMPYLQKQIEMINPKIILALGRVAAQTLLNADAPLGVLRGKT
ncbi:uracil-DNA glycosylase, partial [bacterium]|nr:uracil-DNA glycosylase [bacterium]